MTICPTPTRRTIILAVQTADANQSRPNHVVPAHTEVIICIHLIIDDGARVTEVRFSDAAEADLLQKFWGAVQPDDVFFGCGIVDCLARLRQRSWAWNLIPSREVDLRKVYRHTTVDPADPRNDASEVGYRNAEALLASLGLPGEAL